MRTGWVKFHRCLLDHPVWLTSTPAQKVILMTLLGIVNHQANQWFWKEEKFLLVPGQIITSLDSLKRECGKGISIQNIRTALNKFANKRFNFLTDEATSQGRLISIINWGYYQSKDELPNNQTNKDLTKTSHTSNIDLTPNKECKNVRREECKKEKLVRFAPDSAEIQLARDFWSLASNINKTIKRKKVNSQKWAKDFDLIIRVDKNPIKEVRQVMEWAFSDSFWSVNLQSPEGFRKHYVKIFGKMNGNNQSDGTVKTDPYQDFINEQHPDDKSSINNQQ